MVKNLDVIEKEVTSNLLNHITHLCPIYPHFEVNDPNTNTNPQRNLPTRKLIEFTQIPMSYANLLPSLLSNQMVVVSLGKVYQPPFP